MRTFIGGLIIGVLAMAGVATASGSGEHFDPNGLATRCHAVTFDYRVAGEPTGYGPHPFVDSNIPDWCQPALRWCWAEGICTGVGGTVDP